MGQISWPLFGLVTLLALLLIAALVNHFSGSDDNSNAAGSFNQPVLMADNLSFFLTDPAEGGMISAVAEQRIILPATPTTIKDE